MVGTSLAQAVLLITSVYPEVLTDTSEFLPYPLSGAGPSLKSPHALRSEAPGGGYLPGGYLSATPPPTGLPLSWQALLKGAFTCRAGTARLLSVCFKRCLFKGVCIEEGALWTKAALMAALQGGQEWQSLESSRPSVTGRWAPTAVKWDLELRGL